jgi:PIN domain nuclease of toxin-antitoxin system
MKSYVADTHALYWYLINSPQLGPSASQIFDDAAGGAALIYLPAIVLAELYFLNKKQGQPIDFAMTFAQLKAKSQFVFVSFEAADVLDFDANAAAPEMHDRMIVGAAKRLGFPCLTRDHQIVGSGLVATIW